MTYINVYYNVLRSQYNKVGFILKQGMFNLAFKLLKTIIQKQTRRVKGLTGAYYIFLRVTAYPCGKI